MKCILEVILCFAIWLMGGAVLTKCEVEVLIARILDEL